MSLAKTYRRAAHVCRTMSVAGCQRLTLQLTKRPETHAFLQLSQRTVEACAHVCRAMSVAGCQRLTLQLTKRPETHAFLQLSQRTVEACGILTIFGSKCHGLPQSTLSQHYSQHYSQHCQNDGKPQISRFVKKS